MGNCMRSNNKISAQDEKYEPAKEAKTIQAEKTLMPLTSDSKPKKKTVRFNLQEDQDQQSGGGISGSDCSKSGVVRIRLVVTQEELKQLLSYKNDSDHSSLEELLNAVRSRGTRVSEVGTSSDESISSSSCWRPTLESIPEDQY